MDVRHVVDLEYMCCFFSSVIRYAGYYGDIQVRQDIGEYRGYTIKAVNPDGDELAGFFMSEDFLLDNPNEYVAKLVESEVRKEWGVES